MCSSLNAMFKRASKANFSRTVSSTVMIDSPIQVGSAILPLVLSRSFQSHRSDGCTSLDSVDVQPAGSNYFEKRFRWPPISRRQVVWYMMLFSTLTKVRTKMLTDFNQS